MPIQNNYIKDKMPFGCNKKEKATINKCQAIVHYLDASINLKAVYMQLEMISRWVGIKMNPQKKSLFALEQNSNVI